MEPDEPQATKRRLYAYVINKQLASRYIDNKISNKDMYKIVDRPLWSTFSYVMFDMWI